MVGLFSYSLRSWPFRQPQRNTFSGPEGIYVRVDPGGPVETAYLTWNNGQGGLAWDAEATTDPKTAAVLDAATQAQWTAAHEDHRLQGRQHMQGLASFPSYVFQSAPVPRDLILNASRQIELELYINNRDEHVGGSYDDVCTNLVIRTASLVTSSRGPDPYLDITLTADDVRVTGTDFSQWVEH